MTLLDQLKRKARKAALARFHYVSHFKSYDNGNSFVGECAKCGALLRVVPKPLPNDIQIGGECVAIQCAAPE